MELTRYLKAKRFGHSTYTLTSMGCPVYLRAGRQKCKFRYNRNLIHIFIFLAFHREENHLVFLLMALPYNQSLYHPTSHEQGKGVVYCCYVTLYSGLPDSPFLIRNGRGDNILKVFCYQSKKMLRYYQRLPVNEMKLISMQYQRAV